MMNIRPRSKTWLDIKGNLAFGEGKSELLKAVGRRKSINKAAEDIGISFRSAWSRITEIEKRLGIKLIRRTKGGRLGGGSELTEAARDLIKKYDHLEKRVRSFTDKEFKRIFKAWKK